MSDDSGTGSGERAPARPDGPYWEDPVYRYVSRRHRAAADGRQRRQERKRRGRSQRPPADRTPRTPSVNIADLKGRIFNPNVSRANVIKALEALPPAERRATIAGLPPGLRRKLGDYLV